MKTIKLRVKRFDRIMGWIDDYKGELQTIIIAIIALILFAGVLRGQGWRGPSYTKITKECYICGKTIEEFNEDTGLQYYDSMGIGISGPPNWQIPDSSRTQHFNFSKKMDICPECNSKYSSDIRDQIHNSWERILGKLIDLNSGNREIYKRQRYENKIKDLDKKIDDLKKKRKEVKAKQ